MGEGAPPALPPLRDVICRHGLDARRKLGQHFLLNANVTARIARLPGALAGGLIIGIVEPMAQYFAPPGYSQIMPYAIMLIVLVVRPNGLFAQIQQKKV